MVVPKNLSCGQREAKVELLTKVDQPEYAIPSAIGSFFSNIRHAMLLVVWRDAGAIHRTRRRSR